MNLFGILIIREDNKNKVTYETFVHESIHTEQMKELLYVPFYILYLIFWIVRLLTPPFGTAYQDISFEQEAYLHQKDPDYLKYRQRFAWLKYCFTSYRKSQNNSLSL